MCRTETHINLILVNKIGKEYGLDANELGVYSAIARYSNGKGWFASYQALANFLPFVISTKTIERNIKHLTELGLIERRGKALFAKDICLEPQTKCPTNTDKLSSPNRQIVLPTQTNCLT